MNPSVFLLIGGVLLIAAVVASFLFAVLVLLLEWVRDRIGE